MSLLKYSPILFHISHKKVQIPCLGLKDPTWSGHQLLLCLPPLSSSLHTSCYRTQTSLRFLKHTKHVHTSRLFTCSFCLECLAFFLQRAEHPTSCFSWSLFKSPHQRYLTWLQSIKSIHYLHTFLLCFNSLHNTHYSLPCYIFISLLFIINIFQWCSIICLFVYLFWSVHLSRP